MSSPRQEGAAQAQRHTKRFRNFDSTHTRYTHLNHTTYPVDPPIGPVTGRDIGAETAGGVDAAAGGRDQQNVGQEHSVADGHECLRGGKGRMEYAC